MRFSKKIAALTTVTVLAVSGTIYQAVAASTSDPGTSSDPLVTKSYVDETVSNLLEILNTGSGSASPSTQPQNMGYVPVKAVKGQIVVGGEGAEIILRSGNAESYCEGADGIVDVTTGKEYFNGTALTNNHLIIIPRADGRGAKITSDEAWFIVKGGYTLK